MTVWAKCWRGRLRGLTAVALVAAGLGVMGCGQSNGPSPQAREVAASAVTEANTTAPVTPAASPAIQADRLHLPFTQAVRSPDNPPEDATRPPDSTSTNKSVGKLYRDVVASWNTIRFTDSDGKPVRYTAVIDTDQGIVEIQLKPEVAPNHVRNFVALARAGYYDGLCFDRIHHEEGVDDKMATIKLDQVEAGCPLGIGESAAGSIGYWLKEELSPETHHEEGTVGACRGFEADSAACRFYITLCKAPFLDGNYTVFGKVTRGLDVVRKIYQQPIVIDDQDSNGSRRPEHPVKIKKVTIQTS